jgi:hypothetical protein
VAKWVVVRVCLSQKLQNEKTIAAHEFIGSASALRDQLNVNRSGKFETLVKFQVFILNYVNYVTVCVTTYSN